MNVEIINAFLTEGMNAFNSMFGIEATPNKPHLLDVKALGHQWEISGLLGITGQYKGVVAFRLHKLLANKMLEFSGLEFTEDERDDVAIELVSEFTNVISGRVCCVRGGMVNREGNRCRLSAINSDERLAGSDTYLSS